MIKMLKARFSTFISIVAVLGLLIGAYFYFSNGKAVVEKNETESVFPARSIPNGWREYQSNWYDFSLLYPEELVVKELEESAGINTNTIVFENAESKLGFQIFAVPYGGQQVTNERFLLDVPSGVRENPAEFLVDGVTATSFYSKSMELGDTFEIWFLHGGVLYEVTAPREQEVWLSDIMETWLFL